jgi:gamma-glutamyltranspeptidase/glutathione hydrolase
VHFEDGVVFAEPGIDAEALEAAGWTVQRFRARNLFFGGAQAVARDPRTGALTGGGDPRRGGAVVVA